PSPHQPVWRLNMATRRTPRSPSRRWIAVASLAVLILAPQRSRGQQVSAAGTVTGTVVDRNPAQPLDGTTISIVGTRLGTSTDGRGHFVIRGAPVGTATVRAQRLGYRPMTSTVE